MRARPRARSVPFPRLFSIAIRNLGRHARRSALTGACVAAAAAAVVLFMGFYRGTYDEMFFGAIIDYQTAHAQIQSAALDPDEPDDWARPASTIAFWELAARAARLVPSATGVAPRLELACFAGDGIEKMPALFAGVDFIAEADVSKFTKRIVRGEAPEGRGQVLVGDSLAALFSFEPGSSLMVQASTSSGAPNIARFVVSGIFDTGVAGLDASYVAAHLADAQELADAPGMVNRIYVKLASTEDVEAAMPALAAAAALSGAEARPWTSYAREALDHAKTETVFYYIFLVILVLMSTSAIASTMRVAALERVREIGALRATGWTRADVFCLFAFESGAIGLCGSAAGAALGGVASALLRAFPIDVSAMAASIDYPFFSMTSSSRPGDFLLAAIVGVGSALLAGVAPARKAARTNIAKALTTH
ncbi:MAG: FtsX-like permease family protein [Spirochaetaceae bacterium]|nr:FtsX-like permease family protein [Spirochaetaceae bacterium]